MPRGVSTEDQNDSILTESGERALRIGGKNPIRISAGHRILHHEGKCSRPHGHNYELSVEVRGELTKDGWVVDKGEVTSIINEWDHRFLVEQGDPLIDAFETSGDADSLVVLDHPPTAEVMALLLEERMLEQFPDTVSDVSVEVAETSELCATY